MGRIEVPGYTPLMLALFFVTSTILISLGLVGSYVWRTYENSKGRPGAIPMTHERFGELRLTASRRGSVRFAPSAARTRSSRARRSTADVRLPTAVAFTLVVAGGLAFVAA